jgi:GNAT superfamily N-acetyltransferase
VRAARSDDLQPMCRSLALAFEDDPVMEFLFPAPAGRVEKLQPFFAMLARYQHLDHGGCFTNDGRTGAALWDPPGEWKMPLPAVLRAMPTLLSLMGLRSVTALRTLSVAEKLHPKEPHWYLAVLGTEPGEQGKGVGSALMAPVLERCDREGIPAYLESSKEKNVPFYRRHGFEVTQEIQLPKGPTLWAMWRDPRPPER